MKRILFVDDESNILNAVRRLLYSHRNEWDMHFASNGDAALTLCDACPFDVVISDMRMPGMDGPAFLGHVRDRFPGAARLILSGYSDAMVANRAVSVAHRFLSKPCSGEVLKANITQLCELQDLYCTTDVRALVGSIGPLHSIARTYTALAQATHDPTTTMAGIARIIETDIAMSAKVLQLVYNGFLGMAYPAIDLQRAVNYLGMEKITDLIMASDAFGTFIPAICLPPLYYEELQQQSHRTTLILGTLNLSSRVFDICAMAALVHDIGKLVLASKWPVRLCAALELASTSGCRDFEAEEQEFGASHADIGAYLLGLWGIDALVVEAVARHHRPHRTLSTEFGAATALYVADLLAHELNHHPGDAPGTKLSSYDRDSLERVGLSSQYPALWETARKVIIDPNSPSSPESLVSAHQT